MSSVRTVTLVALVSYGLSGVHGVWAKAQLTIEPRLPRSSMDGRPGRTDPNWEPNRPQLLMIDSAHVARVRDSLSRGETQFKHALAALEADANHALSCRPSVRDGQGSHTAERRQTRLHEPGAVLVARPFAGRTADRTSVKDGQRNPEIDRITDRENLGRLTDAVSTLHSPFISPTAKMYSHHAAQLVRVWFLDPADADEPRPAVRQGIPGVTEGRSAGIIETRFLPTIIDGVTLLASSSVWTAADHEAFKNWMRALPALARSTAHLDTRNWSRGNNQETWADVQVAALALYTGQAEVARKTHGSAVDIAGDSSNQTGRNRASSRAHAHGTTASLTSPRSCISLRSVNAWERTYGATAPLTAVACDRVSTTSCHSRRARNASRTSRSPNSVHRAPFCASPRGGRLERAEIPGPRAANRRRHRRLQLTLP